SSLSKNTTAGWWNSGALSVQRLAASGFVEFTSTETNTTRVLGLGLGDTNQSYTDVDFGIYLDATGSAYVYENGTSRGNFGAYASGDRFRVEAAGSVVRYRKNGVVFYTSALAPKFPLLVDTALNTTGATLTNVKI